MLSFTKYVLYSLFVLLWLCILNIAATCQFPTNIATESGWFLQYIRAQQGETTELGFVFQGAFAKIVLKNQEANIPGMQS